MSEATTRPYLRADAFAVMLYRALDDPGETEEVWNSRDGVTPFTVLLRSGRVATHADWTSMVHRPDFEPPPGSRVFVDLTEEIARTNAEGYVRKIWDDKGAEGMLAREQFDTAEAMIESLIADIQPGEPALIDVPKEGWQR
jgi:hypothetical protein